MSIGKLEPFNVESDNWSTYVERLEQYFVVNQTKEEHKVPTLITVMGNQAYELLVTLCTPDKPASKKFAELVKVMGGHLQPIPSLLAERYQFRNRKQKAGESVADFVAELKKLAKHCAFESGLKENLRDQLVCGLGEETIRQRLFTEDNISFDRALHIAIAMEAAQTNAAVVDGRPKSESGPSTTSECHAVTSQVWSGKNSMTSYRSANNGPARSHSNSAARLPGSRRQGQVPRDSSRMGAGGVCGSSKIECNVCGRPHESSSCRFANYVCRVCNRPGHLKKMCPRLQMSTGTYRNEVQEGADTDFSDEVPFNVFHVNDIFHCKPFMLPVSLEGHLVSMEVDTGSAISCISRALYMDLFSNLSLRDSNIVMCYYTGEKKLPMGKITVNVTFKSICKPLELYVVDQGKTPLLGRQWLHELGIKWEELSCHDVKVSARVNLDELHSRYREVFADGLGRYTGGEVSLRVREGAAPVFLRARPLAYALRAPVERALDQLEQDGVITPVESSDWATPIVPIVKADGTIRVCGDFKSTLNRCLEVDRFPLPRVEDLLAKLNGGEKFTKIDLSQAYAQFVLDERSRPYTVINTHRGLYRYNRLIYGLSSSPGIFQRKLEQMFADLPMVGVFLDDVILTGKNDQEHIATLHKVLGRLQTYGLKIKKEKCTFFAKSVTYLGYVVDKEGIHTNPDKIKAIQQVPTPTNVTELRAFLGMVMYYAKFVKNISTMLAPLYTLLKKGAKFEWSEKCNEAFAEVKRLLASSTVLAHYAPQLPVILTTDASSVGVAGVISHVMPDGSERPIAYASRVLNAAERGYSQIDKEALGIIYSVKKFHQYLYGRKFLLKTDHKPLVAIFGPKSGIPVMAATRMQRWAVILSGYDYDIQYVSSSQNGADALSRLPRQAEVEERQPECTYINFVNNFLPITHQQICEELKKDLVLRKVVLYLQSGWPSHNTHDELQPYFIRRNELYLESGCVMWGYRIVIPSACREQILQELHVGHVGIVKMKAVARSYVWWPGIDADIEACCAGCHTCAVEAPAPPRAPVKPWEYPTEMWTRVHIDFLGPWHGKTFLILVDASSKWIEAFLMNSTTGAAVLKVLREIFARFGLPKQVVSDNGPPFTSHEVNKFMRHCGITHTFTPAYHPASNGAAEAAVKLCKRALNKATRDRVDIEEALQEYLMAYRNTPHSTTGQSPAMLLQRRPLRCRLDMLRPGRGLEQQVEAAQHRQVQHAGGTDREFKVGDLVWFRDYSSGGKWQKGKIDALLGSRTMLVAKENDLSTKFKRHVDQVRSRSPISVLAWPSSMDCPPQPPPMPPVLSTVRRPRRNIPPIDYYGNPLLY